MPRSTIKQAPSSGRKKSGEVACSVRHKRPGERATTVGARGRASTNPVLKACSEAFAKVKSKIKGKSK